MFVPMANALPLNLVNQVDPGAPKIAVLVVTTKHTPFNGAMPIGHAATQVPEIRPFTVVFNASGVAAGHAEDELVAHKGKLPAPPYRYRPGGQILQLGAKYQLAAYAP